MLNAHEVDDALLFYNFRRLGRVNSSFSNCIGLSIHVKGTIIEIYIFIRGSIEKWVLVVSVHRTTCERPHGRVDI